jgi:hypothetical protein
MEAKMMRMKTASTQRNFFALSFAEIGKREKTNIRTKKR